MRKFFEKAKATPLNKFSRQYICLIVIFFSNVSYASAGGAVMQYKRARAQSEQAQQIDQTNPSESYRQKPLEQTLSRKAVSSEPAEEVNIDQIWNELEVSSEVWPLIIDQQPKELTVLRFIEWYKQQNIIIRRPPSHYVSAIDSMLDDGPDLLKIPFKDVLKLAAIIDYDFDNGLDKDKMARQILGEKQYQENRKRLGLK